MAKEKTPLRKQSGTDLKNQRIQPIVKLDNIYFPWGLEHAIGSFVYCHDLHRYNDLQSDRQNACSRHNARAKLACVVHRPRGQVTMIKFTISWIAKSGVCISRDLRRQIFKQSG